MLPGGGAVHVENAGDVPNYAAIVYDILVGAVEEGVEVNDILGANLQHSFVERLGCAEEIGIDFVERHDPSLVQNRVGVHMTVPGAGDDFRIRGDLGENVDKFLGFH